MDGIELFERGANTQCPAHLSGFHGHLYLWQLRLQFGKAQVAMGISEHNLGSNGLGWLVGSQIDAEYFFDFELEKARSFIRGKSHTDALSAAS